MLARIASPGLGERIAMADFGEISPEGSEGAEGSSVAGGPDS